MFVLEDNTVRLRCHVSPHAHSTVALAQRHLQLIVCWVIYSESVIEVCIVTAPPAWEHARFPSSSLPTHLLQRAAITKHIAPLNTTGFCHARSGGLVIAKGVEAEREVNTGQGWTAGKDQIRSLLVHSAVSSHLSLSLYAVSICFSFFSFFKLQDSERIKSKWDGNVGAWN